MKSALKWDLSDNNPRSFPSEPEIVKAMANQIAEDIDRDLLKALEETYRKERGWFQLEGLMPLGFARLPHPMRNRGLLFSEDDSFERRWSRPATPAELIDFLIEEEL